MSNINCDEINYTTRWHWVNMQVQEPGARSCCCWECEANEAAKKTKLANAVGKFPSKLFSCSQTRLTIELCKYLTDELSDWLSDWLTEWLSWHTHTHHCSWALVVIVRILIVRENPFSFGKQTTSGFVFQRRAQGVLSRSAWVHESGRVLSKAYLMRFCAPSPDSLPYHTPFTTVNSQVVKARGDWREKGYSGNNNLLLPLSLQTLVLN